MNVRIAALVLAAAALPLAAQQSGASGAATQFEVPRVTYTKSFRGSVPSFIEVSVRRDGAARFESIDKPGEPPVQFGFTAAQSLVDRIFALAGALHDFTVPKLESKSKVGYMGTKMLAYDDDLRHAQQAYNFTSIAAGRDLTDIFERIAASGEHAVHLAHAARYDRLGVVQQLDGITQDWDEHQLLAPELLEPVLKRVASDPALMEIAHRRANDLLAEMHDAPRVH